MNTCALVRMSIIGLAIYFLSPAAHARSTHLIEPEPVTINCHLPAEEMNEAILKGGAARKWVAIEQMKGVTELKYVKGNNKHLLIVEVSYTADTFAITYKDSVNLNYSVTNEGTRRIHPRPIGWMKNLSSDIQLAANNLCSHPH
ncbi:hypothetical protein MNBD_GAMMA13-659 [hydrothermal vent metagenome]|uniref:Uncharacterized protein n=1 Tax=hydrothermal vent metagenome TaxID=652676 RepID=A0A3B0Z930_9ZZZZ